MFVFVFVFVFVFILVFVFVFAGIILREDEKHGRGDQEARGLDCEIASKVILETSRSSRNIPRQKYMQSNSD